jgi:hypothetical protein
VPEAFKVTLLIPTRDNDGIYFDLPTWTWWSEELVSIVEGFTDMGIVTGWWHGQTDRNRAYVIVVGSMNQVRSIRDLLVRARSRFRQDAMYFEYHPVTFEEVR